MLKKLIYSAALFIFPIVALAQAFSQTTGFINSARDLVDLLIGVVSALALLVFIWGLVKYIAKADDTKEKESGRTLMINGAIALFVLFSIFGILRWIQGEVLLPDTGPIAPPMVVPLGN